MMGRFDRMSDWWLYGGIIFAAVLTLVSLVLAIVYIAQGCDNGCF